MHGIARIIHDSGKIEDHELADVPHLETLQKWVGGWIERVPMFDKLRGERVVVYCNEDGKHLGLEVNRKATFLWAIAAGGSIDDMLCGNVVILTGDNEFMRAL